MIEIGGVERECPTDINIVHLKDMSVHWMWLFWETCFMWNYLYVCLKGDLCIKKIMFKLFFVVQWHSFMDAPWLSSDPAKHWSGWWDLLSILEKLLGTKQREKTCEARSLWALRPSSQEVPSTNCMWGPAHQKQEVQSANQQWRPTPHTRIMYYVVHSPVLVLKTDLE